MPDGTGLRRKHPGHRPVLPASDTAGSPHTQADDVEVGGQRGREALDRLRNVIGRVESSWRPASAEEGFEIVRRRLFEPLIDQAQFKDRDVVARAFADLYRTNQAEFPPECRDADYEKRIRAAYPIHPEIFDRLYTDWSTLVKFQRIRGVLRLMAAVIRLTVDSLNHLATLLVHGRDIRIQRPVTKYLRGEAEKQSLVVIGDPGAGKSGVLHELATAMHRDNQDVVFLAADRLDESLRAELGLDHDLAEVLENWSGDRPGLLFIDALDAARGSGALQVLRELISRVVTTIGSRWRVVASIRVFDLRYSQELQRLFRRGLGEPGPDQYQDNTFLVRHVKVPRFSPQELQDIRSQSLELDAVFKTATPALLELLDIPFNLRLVAEMLSESGERTDFRGIETQVGLLEKYWLNRVIRSAAEGSIREAVLTEIVNALVHERKLTIAKTHILNTTKEVQFSSLCSDNVIVEQVPARGDLPVPGPITMKSAMYYATHAAAKTWESRPVTMEPLRPLTQVQICLRSRCNRASLPPTTRAG
jgi:hypothetical protein